MKDYNSNLKYQKEIKMAKWEVGKWGCFPPEGGQTQTQYYRVCFLTVEQVSNCKEEDVGCSAAVPEVVQ